MRALVVGGNGFIGAHLVERLQADEWDVAVLHKYEQPRYAPMPEGVSLFRGDLSQESLVREAVEGVDIVFHLLWTTTAIHEVANRDPIADVQANLIPSIGLMEACRDAGVKRLLFTSSGGTVYGPAVQVPIGESHPNEPLNAYGVSKLAVEKYLQMFRHLHGLDYAILRPSVPYGPGQNPLARQGAVAVFLYRIARGLPLTIWGDGRVTRDYFYISDLVEGLVACAKRPVSSKEQEPLTQNRIFNIGGAEEISLLHLIEAIETTVGKKAIVHFKPARSFDAPRIVLDTTRAQNELNWQPQVMLAAGLEKTWAWMSREITNY